MKKYNNLVIEFASQEKVEFPMEAVKKLLLHNVRKDISIQNGVSEKINYASNVLVEVEGFVNHINSYLDSIVLPEQRDLPFERIQRFADVTSLTLIGAEETVRYQVDWEVSNLEYGHPNLLQKSDQLGGDLVLFIGKDEEMERNYTATLFLKERV